MSDTNVVVLFGRLTRDPQLSFTPSQTAVADFGLASNRTWKGKDGQKQEKVLFVDLRCFGSMAETINKYFTKGDPILITGSLEFDSWTAQDGTKRSKHRVAVTGFQFLPRAQQQGQQTEPQANTFSASSEGPPPPTDDEIPF